LTLRCAPRPRNAVAGSGLALLLGVLVFVGSLPALAQIRLQAVSAAVEAGVEVVRIELSEPLAAAPASFATQSPRAWPSTCPGRRVRWAAPLRISARARRAPCAWWSPATAPESC
jgi:hypothetical protein